MGQGSMGQSVSHSLVKTGRGGAMIAPPASHIGLGSVFGSVSEHLDAEWLRDDGAAQPPTDRLERADLD